MAKRSSKKTAPTAVKKEKKTAVPKEPENVKTPRTSKPKPTAAKKIVARKEDNKPSLRAVYSNNKYTLLPLGFATDFKTNQQIIIFSDLATGQVHTIALSGWNRWKLKEVKKINTET